MKQLCISVAVGAALLAAQSASACSMVSGYKVPTNLELVEKAERIVIAEVVDQRPDKDTWDGVVVTQPVLTIKGDTVAQEIDIEGAKMTNDPRWVVASDPQELRKPNPGALIGGCVRYMFPKNAKLVLFLVRNDKGALTPFRSPFSRDAEDVPALDSLWVKAIREYIPIAALPKSQRKRVLKERAIELRLKGDINSVAIANDFEFEATGRRLLPYD